MVEGRRATYVYAYPRKHALNVICAKHSVSKKYSNYLSYLIFNSWLVDLSMSIGYIFFELSWVELEIK
jgi:hypothetical protein